MCVSGCCLHPRILPSLFPSFVIVSLHATSPCFFGSSWCWRISVSWHMSLWQQWNFYFVEGSRKEKIGTCPCGSGGIFMLKDLDFLRMPLWQLWIFCDVDGSGCFIRTPQTAVEFLWYWWIWVSRAYPPYCCGTFMILMDLGVSCHRLLWNIYDIDGSGCLVSQTAVEHLWYWWIWVSRVSDCCGTFMMLTALDLSHALTAVECLWCWRISISCT